MKSSMNCSTCFGFLLLAGGGIIALMAASVLVTPDSYFNLFGGDDTLLVLGIGSAIALLGLFMFLNGFSSAKRWNRVVGIVKSHNKISMQDASTKSGVPSKEVRSIIYDAIAAGDLSGSIEGDVFSRAVSTTTPSVSEKAKILVICPYCGAKTEQGLAKCQKCNADL